MPYDDLTALLNGRPFLRDEPLNAPQPTAPTAAPPPRVGMGDVQASPSAQPFDVEAPYRAAGKATGLDQVAPTLAHLALPIDAAQKRYAWLSRLLGAKPGETVAPEYQGPGDPRASAMGEAFNLAMPLHTVFHGTGGVWPAEEGAPLGQFRRAMKNTGEGGGYRGGGEMEGAGAYVAEAPPTGESYRRQLSEPTVEYGGKPVPAVGFGASPDKYARWMIADNMREYPSPSDAYARAVSDARAAATRPGTDPGKWTAVYDELSRIDPKAFVRKEGGALYALDFPDEKLPHVLDFEKPLHEQTPEVQSALAKAIGIPDAPKNWARMAEIQRTLDARTAELASGDIKDPAYLAHATVAQIGFPDMALDHLRELARYDPAYADVAAKAADLIRSGKVDASAAYAQKSALEREQAILRGHTADLGENAKGRDLYHHLVRENGGRELPEAREAASAALRDAGIPAHSYWDQGSRSNGEGTRNFVVYEPDKHLMTVDRFGSLDEARRTAAAPHKARLAKMAEDARARGQEGSAGFYEAQANSLDSRDDILAKEMKARADAIRANGYGSLLGALGGGSR